MANNYNAAIGGLYLSNNGLYLMNNERIYFAKENKSYLLDEISLPKWIDILSDISQFSIKNKLQEIKDLSLYHRKITYQLMDPLSLGEKSHLMLEYEYKFGKNLLTENVELAEGWIKDAWNWTKEKVVDKVKQFGAFAIKTGKDLSACVTGGGCSPLFEDFREMLYSPVGIAVDAFLAATGIGEIGLIIVWGIMLLWDIYLLISGSSNFSWLNIIFDVLGLGLGVFAKSARALFGGVSGVAKTAGKGLPEVIADGMKNPKTAGILMKFTEIVKTSLSKIMGYVTQAGKFLSEKLGIKWIGGVINKISGYVTKILEEIGLSTTMAKGVQSGLKAGTVAAGVTAGAESRGGQKLIRAIAGGNRYEDKLMQKLQGVQYVNDLDF